MPTSPGRAQGELVGTLGGATGRYLCDGLVLVVSGPDNELTIECADPRDAPPSPGAPRASDAEVRGAVAALSAAEPLVSEYGVRHRSGLDGRHVVRVHQSRREAEGHRDYLREQAAAPAPRGRAWSPDPVLLRRQVRAGPWVEVR